MPVSITSDNIETLSLSNQTKIFLPILESARDFLARRLVQECNTITEHDLNHTIISSILQVLFLIIGQECGFAEPGTIALLAGSDGISRRMARACSDAGLSPNILFEIGPDDSRPISAVPDDALREVIRCMDSAKLPVPISTIPLEHLAAILEHFLGTRIQIAEGYHVKRAGKSAVLYTGSVDVPAQPVVDYIVKETIGDVIREPEAGSVTGILILDPACGAGIFLLAVYRVLAHRKTQHLDRPEQSEELLRDLACRSVYGTDIDPESVSAARFMLLLSFIEECRLSGSGHILSDSLREICVCLKSTIRCGNALIAMDYFSGRQEHPFNAGERRKINAFSWQEAFPHVLDGGGFDAVIGAPPPYRPFTVKARDEYFQTHYDVYAKGAGIYGYFIEKGLQVLRPKGSLAYCIPHTFLRANYARPLRKFLLTKQIEEIVDFGDLPVLKTATTYPCIIRVSNTKPAKEFCVSKVETLEFPSLKEYVKEHRHPMDQRTLTDGGWTLGDKRTENLLKKLQSMGSPLEEYTMEQVFRGIITGLMEAFVLNEKIKNELIQMDPKNADIIKPFFIGRDIKRYSPLKAEKYVIYIPWHFPLHNDNSITGASKKAESEFKNQYPSIYNYLLKNKEKLMERNAEETGIRYEWYVLQRFGSNYYTDFEKTKIIYPEICQKPEFAFDESKTYTNNECFIIPRSDKYLLGILNSKLMNFLFRVKLPKLRGGFVMPAYVIFKNFPIYTIDFDNPDDKARHDRMITLVTEMLELHKHLSHAKTDQEKRIIMQEIESTDRQIDSLVYGLYGLTADEIDVVETVTTL